MIAPYHNGSCPASVDGVEVCFSKSLFIYKLFSLRGLSQLQGSDLFYGGGGDFLKFIRECLIRVRGFPPGQFLIGIFFKTFGHVTHGPTTLLGFQCLWFMTARILVPPMRAPGVFQCATLKIKSLSQSFSVVFWINLEVTPPRSGGAHTNQCAAHMCPHF